MHLRIRGMVEIDPQGILSHRRRTAAIDPSNIMHKPHALSRARRAREPCYERGGDLGSDMRDDLRHFTQEAKRRERGAWAYLWFTSLMIVAIVVAFL